MSKSRQKVRYMKLHLQKPFKKPSTYSVQNGSKIDPKHPSNFCVIYENFAFLGFLGVFEVIFGYRAFYVCFDQKRSTFFKKQG